MRNIKPPKPKFKKAIHKEKAMLLPKEYVDRGIFKLVKIFNTFPGIRTQFSCEGTHCTSEDPWENWSNAPYILFTAESTMHLSELSSRVYPILPNFSPKVTFSPEYGLRFVIYFKDKKEMQRLQRTLKPYKRIQY